MNDAAARKPRTKPPGVRREELLAAAERLFLAKGVTATSVDEIVAAAGVAKGTFYLYFTSKEKVLAGLQERYVLSLRDALSAAIERCPTDDWRGRLNAWVETAVNHQLDRSALHDVAFHDAQIGDRHSDGPVIDQLVELLAAGVAAGAWQVDDPRLTGVMLFHAMHGAVDAAFMAANDVNRKKLAAGLTRFFARAVGGPSAPRNSGHPS